MCVEREGERGREGGREGGREVGRERERERVRVSPYQFEGLFICLSISLDVSWVTELGPDEHDPHEHRHHPERNVSIHLTLHCQRNSLGGEERVREEGREGKVSREKGEGGRGESGGKRGEDKS